jgi:hypothetical protein
MERGGVGFHAHRHSALAHFKYLPWVLLKCCPRPVVGYFVPFCQWTSENVPNYRLANALVPPHRIALESFLIAE